MVRIIGLRRLLVLHLPSIHDGHDSTHHHVKGQNSTFISVGSPGLGAGVGPGDGAGEGPGDGTRLGPGVGPGEGAGLGAGDGAGVGPGVGPGEGTGEGR